MEIKKIRMMTEMNRSQFSRYYNIPLRTLEDWESGRSHPPVYVIELLAKAVFCDFGKSIRCTD
jgi:putative transcriptional regulator